eukprot:gene558-953_t
MDISPDVPDTTEEEEDSQDTIGCSDGELWLCSGESRQLCAIPRFVHALFQVQRNKQFLNKDMIDPEKLLQERGTPSEMAKFGATLFLVLHYTGCILFASARAQNFDLTTWVGIYATGFPLYDVDKAPDFERYIFMLHKGADAMTLAGVNFTPPQNSLEALLYCLSMVGQIFMVAYILGTLFHSLVIKDAGMETHKENLAELTKFSQQCRLPEELHTELVNHFKFQYSKQNSFLSNDPSTDLPHHLKLAVAETSYGPIVDRCASGPFALLRNCNREFIREILLLLQEEHLRPCETFVVQNEMGFELSFLSKGTVEFIVSGLEEEEAELRRASHVARATNHAGSSSNGGAMPKPDQPAVRRHTADGEMVLKSLNAESPDISTVIGELAFFVSIPQVCTVRVTEQGNAARLVLPREKYTRLIATYPEQHQMIMQNLVNMYGLDLQGNELANAVINPFLYDQGRAQMQREVDGLRHTAQAVKKSRFTNVQGLQVDFEEIATESRRELFESQMSATAQSASGDFKFCF